MTGHCHLQTNGSSGNGDTTTEDGTRLAAFPADVTALPFCQLIVPVCASRAVQTHSSSPGIPMEWFCFSRSAQTSVFMVRSIFLSFFSNLTYHALKLKLFTVRAKRVFLQNKGALPKCL